MFCLSLGCNTFPMGMNRYMRSTLNLVETREMGEFGIPTSIKSQITFEYCRSPSVYEDSLRHLSSIELITFILSKSVSTLAHCFKELCWFPLSCCYFINKHFTFIIPRRHNYQI